MELRIESIHQQSDPFLHRKINIKQSSVLGSFEAPVMQHNAKDQDSGDDSVSRSNSEVKDENLRRVISDKRIY